MTYNQRGNKLVRFHPEKRTFDAISKHETTFRTVSAFMIQPDGRSFHLRYQSDKS